MNGAITEILRECPSFSYKSRRKFYKHVDRLNIPNILPILFIRFSDELHYLRYYVLFDKQYYKLLLKYLPQCTFLVFHPMITHVFEVAV